MRGYSSICPIVNEIWYGGEMVRLGPFSQSLLVTLINQKLKLAVALGLR